MNQKIITIARNIARTILILVAGFWFVFALLSGAQEAGGGVMGVVRNSPNALPWLLLFVFVWAVFKWELVGGALIALFGVLSIFAFDTYKHIDTFLLITLPLILVGGVFITSSITEKK
jgi:hypothetical protein